MTSAVVGSTSNLNDFKGMGASLVNIDAQFKALEQSLSGMGQNIINKVSETKGVVSEMESVYNQLVQPKRPDQEHRSHQECEFRKAL